VLNGIVNSDSGTIILLPIADLVYYEHIKFDQIIKVRNGRFSISLNGDYPTAVKIGLKISGSWRYISDMFFLEPVDQLVICNIDSSRRIPIIENQSMHEYRDSYLKYHDENESNGQYTYRYLKEKPDSYIGIWELINSLDNGYSKLFDSSLMVISKNLKSSKLGTILADRIAVAGQTAIGGKFHPVELVDQWGKKNLIGAVNSANQYILIDFWFSHCTPCLSQFKEIKDIYESFHSKGFNIIGISVDAIDFINDWKRVIRKYQLTWDQYLDINGKEAKKMNINSYPTNFLLASDGKILARNLSPASLKKWLAEHLE